MAQRLGANVVELDVQMSRDEELIVFHDDTLVRSSDGLFKFPDHTDYSVSSFTWPELSVLDVGTWYVHELARPTSQRQPYLGTITAEEINEWITTEDAEEFESGCVRIPRLRDGLAVARECQLAVILDLKTIPRRYPAIGSKTVALIRDLGMEHETMISSFDHGLLAEVRKLNGTIATGVLTTERLFRVREYLQALDADAYEPSCAGDQDIVRRGVSPDDIDRGAIQELTDAGLWVNVWTENSASRMRTLIDAGVTGIITDYPNRLARALAELGRSAPVRPRMRLLT